MSCASSEEKPESGPEDAVISEETKSFCDRELQKALKHQASAANDREKKSKMWSEIAGREGGEAELVKKAIASMQEGGITSTDPEVLAQAAVDAEGL